MNHLHVHFCYVPQELQHRNAMPTKLDQLSKNQCRALPNEEKQPRTKPLEKE